MRKHLRTAAVTVLAGAALTVVGLLVGPAGSASAADIDIDLEATTGSVTLPSSGGTTSVPVWGYCRRSAPTSECGPVSAPGGPTIRVAVGDVVHVTLHNALPEETSLYVGGQAMIPDTTGADPGATATYTFTAGRPGTYLYEAGMTENHQHQVAMGLYGALVVEPAAGQAYDASTAFDGESVLVLGEIDPNLNRLADPATFDMRDFAPRWTLINGKVHPDTAPIPATSGQTVLLRWVNAGISYHSMAVLGADQHLVALDGNQLQNRTTDISRRVIAETFGPGQTADALVTVPTTTTDRRLAVYDASLTLHNTNAPGAGGMMTFLEVAGAGTETDTSGPATTDVAWAANTLTATVSDALTGGDDIQAAEFYVDSIASTPTPMSADDGSFDSPSEDVTVSAPIASAQHILYVRGQDAAGNWGPFSSVLVVGADEQGPATTAVALDPDRTNGDVDVAVSATGDDSASGNSPIDGAEWAIDGGSATAMNVTTSGPVASVEGTIPKATVAALAEATHVVTVRTHDASGNWGAPAEAMLVVDRTGPAASDLGVDPNPSNGRVPVNDASPAVRFSATLTDPASGGASTGTVQSSIVTAEAFIDGTPGDPGSGIPMEAADGAFSAPTENVYLDIPLTTVQAMTDGPHTLYVRGRDTAGNWGALQSTTLMVDTTGPQVTSLTLTPDPTGGATTASLSASVSDALSAVASVEWFAGSDPGVGNGTPIMPVGTSVSATIDTTALPEGKVTVTVRARDSLGNTASAAKQLTVTRPVSFSTAGDNPSGAGGSGDPRDIYAWSGSAMGRDLDLSASPYGVPSGTDVDGFSRLSATQFYVSFTDSVSLSGVPDVQDEDVVLWNGSGWEMFFDGSAHNVGNTGLDAISVRDHILYFSTDNSHVPGAKGGGSAANIYRWQSGSTYSLVGDASALGLPNKANVDGLVWLGTTDWAFSFAGTTSVPGLGDVAGEDVVRITNGRWAGYFDGSTHGLTGGTGDVDAVDIP